MIVRDPWWTDQGIQSILCGILGLGIGTLIALWLDR